MVNRILFLLAVCGLVASASAQITQATPTTQTTQTTPTAQTIPTAQTAPTTQTAFPRYFYSAGLGLGIGKDDVASYVGNSFTAVVGGGMNFTKMFGADAEYMYYDLNFRNSVKQSQSLQNQSGRMQSISLDGLVRVPRRFHNFSAYGIFGVGFYDRTVSIPTRALQAGTIYQPAWRWWDIYRDIFDNIITPQTMGTNSKVAGGFNYGGRITHPLNRWHDANIFLEWRYHRAYQSDGQTIVMPVTVGLRW